MATTRSDNDGRRSQIVCIQQRRYARRDDETTTTTTTTTMLMRMTDDDRRPLFFGIKHELRSAAANCVLIDIVDDDAITAASLMEHESLGP